MKTLTSAIALSAAVLAFVGCDRFNNQPVSSAAPATPAAEAPVSGPVVVQQAPPTTIIQQSPPMIVQQAPTVVYQQAPVVYREVYVEGRPAPSLRIEIRPTRTRRDAVWVDGRWDHERNERDHHWAWRAGHWR